MIHYFFKENKTVLLTSLLAATLFPIIILTPSEFGIIPRDIGLQLVGYFGSILGGFLTLYGVWWTINDHNKEICLLNEPVITISNQTVKSQNILDSEILQICLTLNNDGGITAKNVSIEFDKPSCISSFENCDGFLKIQNNNRISFIPPARDKKIIVSIFKNKNEEKSSKFGYSIEPMNEINEIYIKGKINYSSSINESKKLFLIFSFSLIKIHNKNNHEWLLMNYNEDYQHDKD